MPRASQGILLALGAAGATLALVLLWPRKEAASSGGEEVTSVVPNDPPAAEPAADPGAPPAAAPAPTAAPVAEPSAAPAPPPAGELTASSGKPVLIGYGSQTGNAKSIAQSIFETCQARGMDCTLSALNDFKKWKHGLADLELAVLVVSTTGNGDAPDNCDRFRSFVKRKSHPEGMLEHLRYTVLALGDTNYDKFCAMGKFFDTRFKDLGAKPFLALGCADEATGLEDVVEPWCAALHEKLEVVLSGHLPPVLETSASRAARKAGAAKPAAATQGQGATAQGAELHLVPSKEAMILCRTRKVKIPDIPRLAQGNEAASPASAKATGVGLYEAQFSTEPQAGSGEDEAEDSEEFQVQVLSARYLTAGGASAERRVVELVVQGRPPAGGSYRVGDAVGITCENDKKDVEAVLSVVARAHAAEPSFAPDTFVGLQYSHSGKVVDLSSLGLPSRCTVRQALTSHFDLCGPLKPSLLRSLASSTSNAEERRCLEVLAGDKACFDAVVKDQSLRFAELLEMFPSCQPSLGLLMACLPPLACRYYSIASSPSAVGKDVFRVAFAVAQWKAKDVDRHGLCTNLLETSWLAPWLAANVDPARRPTLRLRAVLKPAEDFTLPRETDRPVVMIGPGTGVAPFMGFIQERRQEKLRARKASTGRHGGRGGGAAALGPLVLYFGCRHRANDWIYKDEMQDAMDVGVLDQLRLAFSRDQDHKVYVQHLMLQDQGDLFRLIHENEGYVFVCGDGTAMAKDVHEALLTILLSRPHLFPSRSAAEKYIEEMKESGRYACDIWGE
uniref:Methionine synthase reductase n=1 Tax=Rhizochromulina marina TaxID=1034831 RepID=A0A7S2SIT6_9STRA